MGKRMNWGGLASMSAAGFAAAYSAAMTSGVKSPLQLLTAGAIGALCGAIGVIIPSSKSPSGIERVSAAISAIETISPFASASEIQPLVKGTIAVLHDVLGIVQAPDQGKAPVKQEGADLKLQLEQLTVAIDAIRKANTP